MRPFEQIVAEHGPRVLRVCRALLGPADAEDAWSETFLAALKAYPRLEPGSDVQAWLVTIAHRKAIDALRSRRRRAGGVERLPGRAPAGGPPAESQEELRAALRALPGRQREAIVYHYLGELPYREVAAILGNTTDAARRAAADGVAALRRRLRGAPVMKGAKR